MSAQFSARFLFGPPPSPVGDYDRMLDEELRDLGAQEEELSARIEELSGLRGHPGKETHQQREELVRERRRIRNRMLDIGRD
jgi:hypothetical protein